MPSLYELEDGAVELACDGETLDTRSRGSGGNPMKTMESTQAVATILSRYQRRRKCQVPVTGADVYANNIARVCGDDFDLDPV